MRHPSVRLIVTFLLSLAVGYAVSWGVMVGLGASYRFYGFFNLTAIAFLLAALVVVVLDGPLNLRAFDWPGAEEDVAKDS